MNTLDYNLTIILTGSRLTVYDNLNYPSSTIIETNYDFDDLKEKVIEVIKRELLTGSCSEYLSVGQDVIRVYAKQGKTKSPINLLKLYLSREWITFLLIGTKEVLKVRYDLVGTVRNFTLHEKSTLSELHDYLDRWEKYSGANHLPYPFDEENKIGKYKELVNICKDEDINVKEIYELDHNYSLTNNFIRREHANHY